jgi:phospholipid-binding lipoprotein MlaA
MMDDGRSGILNPISTIFRTEKLCRASWHFVSACLLLLALSAGASAAPEPTPGDPYESFNRKVFGLNENFDHGVARPVAVFYSRAVPAFARDGLHNFLVNLGLPVVLANDVLQGDAGRAKDTLGRLIINSTLGVGGLVDVAQKTGVPEHTTDFGVTLGTWGVDGGPFLVLPLLGPSNVRDAAGYGVDIALDPTTWIGFRSAAIFKTARAGAVVIDTRAQNIGFLDDLERGTLDLYATERNVYLQHREAEIHHGKPSFETLPDF